MVRFSGDGVAQLRDGLCVPLRPGPWRPHGQRRVTFVDEDGQPFDDGIAVYAKAPNTFTGEDTLEVTLHGNPLLVDKTVSVALALGARMADPGEFTRRAVLNQRLHLLAAEGIDQVIRATSHAGVAVGRQSVDGRFFDAIGQLRQAVVLVCSELEAWLDHGGDALAIASDLQVRQVLDEHRRTVVQLANSYDVGRRLVDGAVVALAGAPNAGKSSLLNGLVKKQRALVHDIAGTTRDVVEARCLLGQGSKAMEVTLLDTAGLRETDNPVEAAGVQLAKERIGEADLLLIVVDASRPLPTETQDLLLASDLPARLVVFNHIDKVDGPLPALPHGLDQQLVLVSTAANTGQGLAKLESAIVQQLVGRFDPSQLVVASHRQRDLLNRIKALIDDALEAWDDGGPAVVADLLTEALELVDALTGADTREDVLDAVFARFCIGK